MALEAVHQPEEASKSAGRRVQLSLREGCGLDSAPETRSLADETSELEISPNGTAWIAKGHNASYWKGVRASEQVASVPIRGRMALLVRLRRQRQNACCGAVAERVPLPAARLSGSQCPLLPGDGLWRKTLGRAAEKLVDCCARLSQNCEFGVCVGGGRARSRAWAGHFWPGLALEPGSRPLPVAKAASPYQI